MNSVLRNLKKWNDFTYKEVVLVYNNLGRHRTNTEGLSSQRQPTKG